MDTVQISDTRIHQCLKRARRYALDNTRPEERLIGLCGAGPDGSYAEQYGTENVEMSLAPDAGSGNNDKARGPDAAEVVAS
jgi:hypothetical protein